MKFSARRQLILRPLSRMFTCAAGQRDGTRPPTQAMIGFINDQRAVYGVESICRVLPIAPSTYYHRLACLADPSKASARHQRDTELRPEIKRVWDENYQVYGVRKAWHQLKREGFELARCTVERLMKQVGIRGAVRGKVAKTTIPDTSAPCPRDKVNRVFRAPAPNLLWVSDFTYVSTTARQCIAKQCHERGGRALSMWPSSSTHSLIASSGGGSHGPPKRTLFSPIVHCCAIPCRAMDALEQALHDRRPVQNSGLVHHSDRPSRDIAAQCPAGQWAGNICQFATPSVWLRLASNRRSAASGIPTTTPSLKR